MTALPNMPSHDSLVFLKELFQGDNQDCEEVYITISNILKLCANYWKMLLMIRFVPAMEYWISEEKMDPRPPPPSPTGLQCPGLPVS